jgi:sigma54-dependent transcription regulator
MDVRMPSKRTPCRVYNRNHTGTSSYILACCRGHQLLHRLPGRTAELAKQLPVVEKVRAKHLWYGRDFNRVVRRIDASFLEVLSRYSWPGNVRELENAVLRIMTYSTSDRITVGDLPFQIAHRTNSSRRLRSQVSSPLENGMNTGELDFEEMVKKYSRDLR